jgi:hypothetical protein
MIKNNHVSKPKSPIPNDSKVNQNSQKDKQNQVFLNSQAKKRQGYYQRIHYRQKVVKASENPYRVFDDPRDCSWTKVQYIDEFGRTQVTMAWVPNSF